MTQENTKRRGCLGFIIDFFRLIFSSVRNFFATVIITFQLILVCIVLLLVFRPKEFWSPFKNHLNQGIKLISSTTDPTNIYSKINGAEDISLISLNEDEVASLIEKKYPTFNGVNVDIEENSFVIYLNIDYIDDPLWFRIEFSESLGHAIRLESIGFVRYQIPKDGLKKFTTNKYVVGLLEIAKKENMDDIIQSIIEQDKLEGNYYVSGATTKDDQLVLIIEKIK